MNKSKVLMLVLVLSFSLLGYSALEPGGAVARADGYPERPITIIVPAGAGGGTDILTRSFVANAGNHFGQPLIVQNVPGGEFTIGVYRALTSAPDGYTLLATTTDPLVFAPHIMDVEYDIDDVEFIDTLAMGAAAISVNPRLGIETMEEFLAYVKENPNELQIAQSSLRFNACIELMRDAGFELENVPFPHGSDTVTALAGGHIDAAMTSVAAVEALHQSGNAIILAISLSDEFDIEGVPGISEFPELDAAIGHIVNTTLGLVGPKGIPQDRLDFIFEAVRKSLAEEEFVEMSTNAGLPPIHMGAEAFEAAVRAEFESAKALGDKLEE